MANPRAQRPLTLDQAVSDIKSLAQPAQALGDMMASTLRGSVAGTVGLPGDIRELINLFGREAVERVLGKRVMPTTEEMGAMMPKATAQPNPYESIGEFLPTPGSGAATKAAGYALGRGAGALTRNAGQAISDAMIHQTGPLASGPLSALAPRMAMTNVVKPKGGNWLSGKNAAVESQLGKLKMGDTSTPEWYADRQRWLEEAKAKGDDRAVRAIEGDLDVAKRNDAMNAWIEGNLKNYVKKEMGTEADPVRKLAEQDILHMEPYGTREAGSMVMRKRAGLNYPAQGLGESEKAKFWERLSDQAVDSYPAGSYKHGALDDSLLEANPWLQNVPDETMIHSGKGLARELGFDHVIDVLRQDVREGRIRPEQLNKVSMEQAVRRTHEYDQEMARKMAETQAKVTEGMPVHKEYPEGYKWIELAKPKDLPSGYKVAQDEATQNYQVLDKNGQPLSRMEFDTPDEAVSFFNSNHDKRLEEALKYEGDTMGHCVGGYCPDVLEGRSRIFSLRDKKGEPHVTVEVEPIRGSELGGMMGDLSDEEAALIYKQPPQRIVQIKGKQNRAPKEEYLPYVQDFVRSGEWSDVGDLHNTGLIDMSKSAIPWSKNIQPEQIDQLVGGMEGGTDAPRYKSPSDLTDKFLKEANKRYVTQQEFDDFLLKELTPPEEGMAAGGTPRYPTEQEREAMRKLREAILPDANKAERLKRVYENLEKDNKKVSISDNPDTMMMELNEAHMGKGGLAKEGVEGLLKLVRAPAKSKAEIESIAQRIAPQMTGEYVRGKEGAKTVAGKTQKQFEREKTLEHDIRPTAGERPPVNPVDIESLKGNVMMGIAGDPTITGQTVHSVAGRELRSPSPQHGGPLYGLGHGNDSFWASQLGAARKVQNSARALGELYEAPVVGNYVKMGPDSYSYAQHFADANLQNIRPETMTKSQIEGFNKMVREGYPYVDNQKVKRQRIFPSFPGVENPEEAYLHMAIDPDLRKHFGNLMQMPTVTEKYGMPSGQDVAHAVTEPDLRDVEIGVTGKSMGLMRPEVKDLKLSQHPTYSHDIPGQFIGGLKYPTPYELTFPDTLKSVRENPKQAPQEFGSFKMVGPTQIIDPQLIDEIKQYEEFIKKYTGKKKGGEVHMADGGITGDDLILEERPL